MKKHLYILLVCVVSLILGSCENQQNKDASKKLEAWYQQMSHFMGKSMYQNGDEILMITEKGEEEIFKVDFVDESVGYDKIKGGDNAHSDKTNLNIEGDLNSVYFTMCVQSSKDTVCIDVFKPSELVFQDRDDLTEFHKHTYAWLAINMTYEEWSTTSTSQFYPPFINDFDVNQSTISITGASGTTAVFQYDVGLIQLSDTMGHTWTKK